MSDEAVARALGTRGGAPPPSSAADYLASVLGSASVSGLEPPPQTAARAEGESRQSAAVALQESGWDAVQAGGTGKLQQSNWERYTLAEGIELHTRRPASREEQRRVERILAAATRILNE